MPITLVVADPHPLVLLGMECLFRQEGDFQVLAQCKDCDSALAALKTHKTDILLTEIDLPGGGGLALAGRLGEQGLPTRVVLLASQLSSEQATLALKMRIDGVVLKGMPVQLLLQCLRKVHAGGQWLEKESFSRAMESILRREAGARQVMGVLSPREIAVVESVAQGMSNREIGQKLFISEGTVKIHLGNIYRKLGIDSRVDLVMLARDKGLV